MRRTTLLMLSAPALLAAAAVPVSAQTIPLCFGQMPTIVGTEGDDSGHVIPMLEGTAGDDVLVGLGGDDWMTGTAATTASAATRVRVEFNRAEDAAAGNDRIAGNGGRTPSSAHGRRTRSGSMTSSVVVGSRTACSADPATT